MSTSRNVLLENSVFVMASHRQLATWSCLAEMPVRTSENAWRSGWSHMRLQRDNESRNLGGYVVKSLECGNRLILQQSAFLNDHRRRNLSHSPFLSPPRNGSRSMIGRKSCECRHPQGREKCPQWQWPNETG